MGTVLDVAYGGGLRRRSEPATGLIARYAGTRLLAGLFLCGLFRAAKKFSPALSATQQPGSVIALAADPAARLLLCGLRIARIGRSKQVGSALECVSRFSQLLADLISALYSCQNIRMCLRLSDVGGEYGVHDVKSVRRSFNLVYSVCILADRLRYRRDAWLSHFHRI
ncbi:hypothetical protein [Acidovorax sp. FG27]|uniref:hypothetical protein n=1 Tax=Acidovorax sp. FG27 TaxID=3133652 RepID=UPI0033412363